MTRKDIKLILLMTLRGLGQAIKFPLLPIIAMPVILFAPVWLTGKALFWGTPYLQFVPWRAWAWQTLQSGHLPVWNPLVGMGAPLVANYQSALFYPVNWLSFLFDAVGGNPMMAWGQTWLVIAHLVWAGVGMVLLARRLGLNQLAQAVSGVSFELSGYLIARVGFFSINASVAWLPWILLAGFNLAGSKTTRFVREVLPLALCVGMQLLAGHAQTSYYTLLLLLVWIIFWAWRLSGWHRVLRVLLSTFLAVIIATGLAAVQLFPTAEYLLQSQRAGSVDYDYAMNYSFFPLRFLTLLAANLFGSPAQGNYLLKADNYWEDAVYIGLLPLLLGFGAITSLFRSDKRISTNFQKRKPEKTLILFLIIVSIISFLLAMGKNTPIFPFLYRYIPTFNLFQAPARFTLWAEFGLALLAGIGANSWIRPTGRARYWMNLGIAAGVAVMLGSALTLLLLPGVGRIFISATAIAGFIGMISGFLAKNAPQDLCQEPGKIWKWLVILLICIDLWIAHEGLNPGTPTRLYQTSTTRTDDLKSFVGNHRIYIDMPNEEKIKYQRFFRFNSFLPQEDWINLKDVYLPDTGMLYGISSANNFDPMVPARYEFWMQFLDKTTLPIRKAMLQLMDVSIIEEVNSTTSTGTAFTPLSESGRLHWSGCAVMAISEKEAWELLINRLKTSSGESSNLYEPVILEGQGIPKSSCTYQNGVSISLQVETPNRLVAKTQAASGGWLVLSDVWYPGWIAKVDGKVTHLLRADYLFRGVAVPAGEHIVEFVYQPISFYAGVATSLLVLAGIIISYVKGAKLCR